MEKQEYLKKFAEKLSITVKEVESDFNKILDEYDDVENPENQQRSLQRLALYYKKQLRSPVVGFEGIIIGTSDCVDIVARKKREAIELFRIDPQTAISEGITNEEGIPLDTRKEWSNGRANNQYGKLLPENNFLRNVWGIVKKSKDNEGPKFFSMIISGQKAQDETIPVFKPIKFSAIDKSIENSTGFTLNASTYTEFVVDNNMDIPKIEDIVKQNFAMSKMSEIELYHNREKDNFNRLCIVEGDVSALNLEPTAFGSRIMSLEDTDASLEDLDSKSLTCWLPERIKIDFAEGSKVLVVGRTAQGKKKDEQGNVTEELGDVTMNVYGLYALPDCKIELPKEIMEITEEELELDKAGVNHPAELGEI